MHYKKAQETINDRMVLEFAKFANQLDKCVTKDGSEVILGNIGLNHRLWMSKAGRVEYLTEDLPQAEAVEQFRQYIPVHNRHQEHGEAIPEALRDYSAKMLHDMPIQKNPVEVLFENKVNNFIPNAQILDYQPLHDGLIRVLGMVSVGNGYRAYKTWVTISSPSSKGNIVYESPAYGSLEDLKKAEY